MEEVIVAFFPGRFYSQSTKNNLKRREIQFLAMNLDVCARVLERYIRTLSGPDKDLITS